jgi:ABC-2 type transport system permease protein
MKNLLPLMQREWLQHRFAWTLLVLVPLAITVLLLGLGSIQLDDEMRAMLPRDLALMLAALSLTIGASTLFLLLGATSCFIALGSPRRDHGDRSIEYWLSLPSGHAESLAAPMLVHLLLVPMVALFVGLVVALPVSMLVVGRIVGVGEWFALPWGQLLGGMLAFVMRIAAGVPLALLWLLPLLMAALLANAYFKRWGLPLLVVALVLLSLLLERVFGQPLLTQALTTLLTHAGTSLAGAGGESAVFDSRGGSPVAALAGLPGWALRDFGAALRELAQPALAGGLLLAAGFFAALVAWRRNGASAA